MKRKIVMGLLALGTIGGFASGFASMGCRAQHRRQAFENRVAETCVRAAKTVEREDRAERAEHAESAPKSAE
jgi:hypothetical protein